jgi:hypothetical protein
MLPAEVEVTHFYGNYRTSCRFQHLENLGQQK